MWLSIPLIVKTVAMIHKGLSETTAEKHASDHADEEGWQCLHLETRFSRDNVLIDLQIRI